MDGDRWTCLAVRAYAKGLLDFSEHTRIDDRWQLREEILLAEIERDSLAKLHEMLHTAESSMAQYVEQRIFDFHYKQAKKQYHNVSRLLYPYATDSKAQDERTLESLEKLWLQEFKDPNGDAVREAIAALKDTN